MLFFFPLYIRKKAEMQEARLSGTVREGYNIQLNIRGGGTTS